MEYESFLETAPKTDDADDDEYCCRCRVKADGANALVEATKVKRAQLVYFMAKQPKEGA